ncbi:MAG: 3'-5' exonuclease domain-containing protein 2 [Prevotella sp.]|nr:3'-5' exonuclease domain-containing protein 2 [Prevotella sp.]
MKVIYSKYDKKQIPTLPRVVFPGRKIVIISEGEAERAVDYLLRQSVLGFDTETRPSFKKGRTNMVALLQVSTYDTCFLFRLNRIGLCPAVVRLLESTSVKKVGLSWKDDLMGLHRRGDFSADGFTDLQDHMKELGIVDMSLAKLYANIFGERISKREQLSNWEADVLSEKQQNYAATDAWACLRLYDEYERLKQTGDYELIVVPEEQPANDDTETNKANEQTNIS